MVMVIVQLAFAGMIITSKLAMEGGMNPFVQSAYKPIFATISIAPFAYFLERIIVNQYFCFIGIKNSTPTIVSAIDYLIPAFTFIITVPLRTRSLYILMFNPLVLVISAFLSWILLREKLYLGVVVGSIIVVAGLYGFLWGKKMETNAEPEDIKEKKQSTKLQTDLELQLPNFCSHHTESKQISSQAKASL